MLIQYVTKPMIVAVLLVYFNFLTGNSDHQLKNKITMALAFSWIGDVLLLFQPRNEIFFLLGLSSFLIAHIFYVIFFNSVKKQEKVRSKLLVVLIVAIYYSTLIIFLHPHLGAMKLPVALYGMVISFMLLLSLHMPGIINKNAGRLMAAGAILFVISDSLLAINKFYSPFEMAGILVMLTYGVAQLLIVEGAAKYIGSVQNSSLQQ